jgi:hypothetical protein
MSKVLSQVKYRIKSGIEECQELNKQKKKIDAGFRYVYQYIKIIKEEKKNGHSYVDILINKKKKDETNREQEQ